MGDTIHIGKIIKNLRVAAGISQEDLADSICTREYLGRIERGVHAPTIDVIDALSLKLNQNIYELYSLLQKHCDINTHNKIEMMNEYFSYDKISDILPLLEEYSSSLEFNEGEPFQILMYGYALYYSLALMKYETSIEYSLKGLLSKYGSKDQIYSLSHHYSNVDMTLMQHLAVNTCRLGDEKGLEMLDFMLNYLFQVLSDTQYKVNALYQYEAKVLGSVCYNKYIFLKRLKKQVSDNDFMQLDNTVSLLKKNKTMFFLPELLLIRGNIYKQRGKLELSKTDLQIGNAIGSFLYDDNYLNKIINESTRFSDLEKF
ncbi:MAG: helix-turn-helix domain-containing protein [Lachnospiraceae bacterium]|nr:helix-turn-helix domain-containing protein [Lachnospiraceae bacterium]